MKNARLLFALILVGVAAACSADPTASLPDTPRSSTLIGAGYDIPPDTTKTPADSTRKGG
jgi:hypothetical protein